MSVETNLTILLKLNTN